MPQEKLILIDAHALIHRMFHALPEFSNAKGEPTGALFGVARTLLKILKKENPTFIAAAFDRPETTFRKEMYADYKAHRPKTDDILIAQLEKSRALFNACGITVVEKAGYEGDDIIGTLATQCKDSARVTILTGDLDALQLVEDGNITVTTFRKGVSDVVEYDEAAVMERFGVGPKKLVDWKALVGDQSDNIPGVPGIGAKGAAKLLAQYASVEAMFKAETPETEKVRANKESAILSKRLATIEKNLSLGVTLKDLAWKGFQNEDLKNFFKECEFTTLLADEILREKGEEKEIPTKPLRNSKKTKEPICNWSTFISPEEIKEKKILMASHELKVAHDWKSLLRGAKFFPSFNETFFDTMLATWLLNPDAKDYSWESSLKLITGEDGELTPTSLVLCVKKAIEKIHDEKLERVFYELEMPLVPILAKMESMGVCVNSKKLSLLGKEIEKEITILEKEIFALAGEEFNLNSPQQVGVILFEKLLVGGKKRKKTKTGQSSTKEDVLSELSASHPIIPLILAYRENKKILSTYVDPLGELSKNDTVHTSFVQTGTATGRISSEKPNLQNLPQESKWSVRLRDAFEARKGMSFVAFDYSQLELRIIGHISKDPGLIRAFKEGKDIHTATAQKIFHTEHISPQERRVAKTLNFGLAYGMGVRAVAKTAKVSVGEATRYRDEYFTEFPLVRAWQESEKKKAKTLGYVETETGRKRWFGKERNFFEIERAAVNMPIQGLEADIVKKALIESVRYIENKKMKAFAVLTIHDELIYEVSDAIVKSFTEEVGKILSSCFPLSVPLTVEVKIGKTLGTLSPLQK